jgi:2-polyprenyl-3-methyl-5-hydroxy-6-metoxy-1,4-benzoquinol methylase
VGCWLGGFGETLKLQRPQVVVTGIEPNPGAALVASRRIDETIVGTFPEGLAAGRRFDCIVFNDVLEHMKDPWRALLAGRDFLSSGGSVVASIPNVRHWTVVVDLLMRGRWTYTDAGILDRDHLRFFTRQSIRDLFHTCGYDLQQIAAIHTDASGSRFGRCLELLGRRTEEFRAMQFLVVAASSDFPGTRARGGTGVRR